MSGTLNDVKPGDKLLASAPYSSRLRVVTVDRVTQTQVICGADRFNKRTGRLVGSTGYHSSSAWVPTPEQLADERLRERIRRADAKLKAFLVSDENVEAVEAFLREAA